MTAPTQKEQAGFTRDDTIIFTLGKIESSQASIDKKLDGFVKDAHESQVALEKRVSSLETKDSKRQGATLALSAVLATIGSSVFSYFVHR